MSRSSGVDTGDGEAGRRAPNSERGRVADTAAGVSDSPCKTSDGTQQDVL
ncbi:hypothetical protein [Halosolutus halophilus]|nr:hypothetical protein [Halosolutus halophilus]